MSPGQGRGKLTLRQARPDEIAALWQLRTRAVAHACAAYYRPEVLAAWLASPAPASLYRFVEKGCGILAANDDQLLGYAVLDADSGEVEAVFVAPEQHGRGIGRLLLDTLETQARAAGHGRLFLSASLNAVPFYARAGFIAVREELYPHRSGIGIPSVFMEKVLD